MKKSEFSKKICTFSIIQFIICVIISMVITVLGYSTDFCSYLIPSSSAIAAAGIGFYANKAKAENLSKQKLRNVVLKLTLEQTLTEEQYFEICQEIENIDDTISAKLDAMHQEAIDSPISDFANEVI